MFSRILKWIDERWPLTPFIRLALEEDMSGGAGYAYVFGSSALIIFLLQVATGDLAALLLCADPRRRI